MNKEIWKHPKQESSLDEAEVPLWFWNAKLEKGELIRQLELQTEIGVKATNPHARTENGAGYSGGYLDEEWFSHMKTVLDYKKKHGEKMWLYDEIDWPAGTCNKTITENEKYREQYITIDKIPVPAGVPFRLQLRTFEGAGMFGMTPDTDYSAIPLNIHILDKETGKPFPLSDSFLYGIFGPELEFKSNRDAEAYVTHIHVDAYEYGGDESVNYLDKNATDAFLRSTYEKYYEQMGQDFGSTVTTVFNDETRMCNAIPWCREFPEVFRKRHGYDIRQELYRIILPGTENGRIRVDYYDTVAYLYQTRYFKRIHSWCEKHNLKFFAHLLAEETLFGHVRYSGDYMRQNRYQDIVGADYLGKGIGSLNLKFTSAAAHSYGKKMTAVEIFAGCGWDLTFDEYTRMITFAFQQGMQTIINHGFFYSTEGERANDWPPSEFFQWKYWNRQSDGNNMIRRLQYAMSGGINEADVIAYLPTETLQMHCIPDQNFTHAFSHGPFLRDDRAVHVDREIQLLFQSMLSANIDFELLHRDAIGNFAVRDGKITNITNGQRFSVLLLPMCEVLPLGMAKLAEAFAAEGGRIVLVDDIPSLGTDKNEDKEICRIMGDLSDTGSIFVCSSEDKNQILKILNDSIPHPVVITRGVSGTVNQHPSYPAYLIDPYMHTGEDLTGVQFVRYLKDGMRNTLFMNYGSNPETIEVRVQTKGEIPEIWDTLTGEARKAEVVTREEYAYVIRMQLPCNHGVFIVSSC